MSEQKNKINWFIGHMKKTVDVLEVKKKNIDFIIEVVDARMPFGSSNQELLKIFNNKPIIKIAIKKDLINMKDKKDGFIYCSIKEHKEKNRILNLIESKLKNKLDSLKKKGMVNPILIGMVVGLPNVGKSSLINYLANRKLVNVANKPGVTRKVENIKVHNNIYLLDTPGVFMKNVEDYNEGLNLALINCVNRNVVDKKDLGEHLFSIMKNNNLFIEIEKKYNIKDIETFQEFINQLANKRNINLEINENENNLILTFIKDMFDEGKNKISLE